MPNPVLNCLAGGVWMLLLATTSPCLSADTLEEVLTSLPAEYDKLKSPVLKGLERYRQEEQAAVDSLKSQLNAARTNANANGNALAAADWLAQIDALEKWLENGGSSPDTRLMLNYIYAYADSLASARSNHIDRVAGKLMKKLNQDNRAELVLKIGEAFNELGGILNASHVLKEGKVFGGYRVLAGTTNQTRIEITIEKVLGNSFAGKIERDTGISRHPVHTMAGAFNGMALQINTLGSRVPGNKEDNAVRYQGLAVGNTLIGQYSEVTAKGKSQVGSFRLDMR